jgi:hypothetical protein
MGISVNESCVMSLDIPDDMFILEIDEDKDKTIESSNSFIDSHIPI